MSILIRGMEMPKNCDSCPCYYETEGAWRNECEVLQREHYITNERPDWCPLVELQPHGRLIDADALMAMCGMAIDCYDCPNGEHGWCKRSQDATNICKAIEDAPTIIETEEGE